MASTNGKSPDDQPNDGSIKTSFMRRFSRLSAKTRSKYRNELRRSTSLLELETKKNEATEVESKRDTALTNWMGNRLRQKKLEENGKKLESVVVGDTLLKQKPRLRVRNIGKSSTLGTRPDYLPPERQSRSATVGAGARSRSYSEQKRDQSTSELSEMEQVLFRAARLRNRPRGRSASIETRGTDRTSQLDKYSLNTEKISDCFDSDSHDDSFMLYGSCAKTYNAKKEDLSPEIVSLSTEYDPNSTSSTLSEYANDGSSGYASYSSSPLEKDKSRDKLPEKSDKVEKLPNLIVPEPPVATVARADAAEPSTSPPSLFYVALVGQDKRQESNANYRVRSGYTGPSLQREEIRLKKTQSMNEVREEQIDRGRPWLQRNNFARGSLPVNYPKHVEGDQLSTSTKSERRASCNSRDGFIIKPENVKVTESGGAKDEWKITIKISREKDDPSASSESYSRASTSEAESYTSQPGRHTIVREARLRKKRSGSLPPAPPPQKSDQVTQTSPVSTPRAATPDSSEKSEPRIKTLPQSSQPDLVNRFKRNEVKRTDVLPDMPRRSYLSNVQATVSSLQSRRNREEPKNFASILSKWENRCHLSRAASVEVLNTEARSRTNSTSTTTSATTTSCLTANQKVQPDSPHRATIEPRPTFQPIMAKTASTEEKTRLPPLDSGPIFSRNRNRFGSSLTRYGSDTTVSQRNRTFDQVGDMGRYQYRQGPVGWKNPIQGL